MIVCVCKAVSDRLIRAAIDDGVATFEDLQFELGVSLCCGKCESSVRELVSGAQPMTASNAAEAMPIQFYQRKAA